MNVWDGKCIIWSVNLLGYSSEDCYGSGLAIFRMYACMLLSVLALKSYTYTFFENVSSPNFNRIFFFFLT